MNVMNEETTKVLLKINGRKYSGPIIFEDDKILIIDDIKIGRLEIAKDEIALRGDF